ncbi:MAG: hypothetical protein MJB14_08910 [Spirochaetes bacterium]|nr:hypothetical protein [Spirochaetota bacterium]
MNKRIFEIDKDCFIVYTGLSSADYQSFLRIGNKDHLSDEIQKHIRFIVVPDAENLDFQKEKENIEHMEQGKIKYICNQENQDVLFHGLEAVGVDTKSLYHKKLSKNLNNISKIENKKHFFTIFYENKNIKLVFNEEIFFDLFNYHEHRNYKKEEKRLNDLIAHLMRLNGENKSKLILKDIPDDKLISFDYEKSALFIVQDNIYIPLSIGMFKIRKVRSEENFEITFNCSHRFYVGKEASLTLIARGEKDISLNGFVVEGEVLEKEVLYQYRLNFSHQKAEDFYKIISMYKYFINKG